MAEKPILFNTEMVRAILDGRKTVTRRVVPLDIVNRCDIESDGKSLISYENDYGDFIEPSELCRYRPGDILWVRETWRKCAIADNSGNIYAYKANVNEWNARNDKSTRWRPSIFMPREAARIFLRVTGVRVERLRDISIIEAVKEGCENILRFDELWDSTIKPADRDRYGWSANPWVWVITFERTERPVSHT